MSLLTSMQRTADVIRGLASPTTLSGGPGLGVWISTMTVRTRTWPGPPGRGMPVDSDLLLSPNPEIHEVTAREVASSGGLYRPKDLRVAHITPYYAGPPSGGYTPEQLAPRFSEPNKEAIYIIAGGPNAGEYSRIGDVFSSDNTEYQLVLRRMNRTP